MKGVRQMLFTAILPELRELVANKDFKQIKEILFEFPPTEIAQLIEEFPRTDKALLYRLLPKSMASEVFSYLDHNSQSDLLESLSSNEVQTTLENLPSDERTELFEEMPAGIVKRYITMLSPENRRRALEILNYPEDSVGRLVTTEYIDISSEMTCIEVLERIRRIGLRKETIYYLYVIDATRKLAGIVSLRDIVLNPENAIIKNIMQSKIVSVSTTEDQETAVHLIKEYDLLALPVVDSENRLVGIITVDDIMDVQTEEATEDFQKIAAVLPTEKGYFETKFFSLIQKRIFWLLILILAEWFSGTILNNYALTIQSMVALSFFIPMLLDTGGNTGTQSATLIIRGLATGEIQPRDTYGVIKREIMMGISLGLILCFFAFGRAYLLNGDFQLAMIVGLTLTFTIFAANIAGATLPLIFKALGMDPALMAGPFITTIVDVVGLILYFEIAKYFLQM